MTTQPSPGMAELLAHTRWVEDLARSLVRDPSVAADVAQSTLLVALERREAPRSNLRAWLASVLRNQVRERGRREAARFRVEQRGARPEALPAADEIVERAECERRTVEAVLALEDPHRTTLLLRYFEGLSPESIAQRSNVPLATVTSRITRAHARLRERLSNDRAGTHWLAAIGPIAERTRPAFAHATHSATHIGVMTMNVAVSSAVAVAVAGVLVWWLWPDPARVSEIAAIAPQSSAPALSDVGGSGRSNTLSNEHRAVIEQPVATSADAVVAAQAATVATPTATTAIGGRIFGRVFRPDGQPAPKRKIRMALMNHAVEKYATTDESGTFDERDLDSGAWALSTWPDEVELEALGKTAADTLNGMTYMRQQTVDLERGHEIEVTFGKPTEHAVRVHGRMLVGGAPVDGYMTWLPDGRESMDRQRLATTSAENGYEVVLDGPGRHLLVAIQNEVRAEFVVDVRAVPELEYDIVFPDSTLNGRVLTADGKPVAGAGVDLLPRAGVNPRHPSANIMYSRKTDAEGKFTFRCLPRARYSLSTHGGWIGKKQDNMPASAVAVREVDMRDRLTPMDVDLVVATGSVVKGSLHSETVRLGGTFMFVFAADGEALNPLQGINADKDGLFELFALAPGRYFVLGAAGLSWTDVLRFEVPAQGELAPLSLDLKPVATVNVDIAGREPAWIDVRDSNNCCISAVLDMHVFNRDVNRDWSSTSFLYHVPAGNYDVKVLSAGDAVSAHVDALSGQVRNVDLRRK